MHIKTIAIVTVRYIKNVVVDIYHIVNVLKITFSLELLLGAVVIGGCICRVEGDWFGLSWEIEMT